MTRPRFLTPFALAVALAVTPAVWFSNGKLVDGADTDFPLDPVSWFHSRLYAWDSLSGTGTDSSSTFPSLFFHGLQAVPAALGLPLFVVQMLTFCFWFVCIGLTAYALAAVLDRGALHQGRRFAAAGFYAFSIYLFDTWGNAKVANLALTVALPAIIALVVLGVERRITLTRAAALVVPVAIVTSGIGLNPPYVAVLGLAIVMLLVFAARPCGIRRTASVIAVVGAAWTVTSLYWLLPLADYIVHFGSGVTTSTLNAQDWVGGLSQHTSLLNVLRVIGAWDWWGSYNGLPYQSYATSFLHNPFGAAVTLVFPLLAWGRVLLRPLDWRHRYFLALSIVGIALAAGAHQPFGGIYMSMMNHVPYFSVFRSPWYIFTPLVTVSYAVLASDTISALARLLHKRLRRRPMAIATVLILAAVGFGWYSAPLLTGSIFGGKGSANQLRQQFPPETFSSARWLNQTPVYSRVLLLPRDSAELLSWGYGSATPVLDLFAARPIVHQPYQSIRQSSADRTMTAAYDALYAGSPVAAKLLGLLGIRYLNYRYDARPFGETGYPEREFELSAKAMQRIYRAGSWDFFTMKGERLLPHVYAAVDVRSLATYLSSSEIPRDWRTSVFVGGQRTALAAGRLAARPPSISVRRVNPTRYDIAVRGSQGRFVLVLGETFDRNWEVQGGSLAGGVTGTLALDSLLQHRLVARHFESNGYANAWLIDRRGSFDLTLEYRPQALFGLGVVGATGACLFALAVAGLALARRGVKNRGRLTARGYRPPVFELPSHPSALTAARASWLQIAAVAVPASVLLAAGVPPAIAIMLPLMVGGVIFGWPSSPAFGCALASLLVAWIPLAAGLQPVADAVGEVAYVIFVAGFVWLLAGSRRRLPRSMKRTTHIRIRQALHGRRSAL